MSILQTQQADASSIRRYIRTHYFEPARKRRETLVTLRAGDIHRELGLRNRVPNVCQVMESKLLEKEAGVKVSSKQGPPSGRGTTLTVTYTVDLRPAPAAASNQVKSMAEHPGVALFYALRGQGKEMYAAEGGGEAWLKRERDSFYSPDKKDLK
jgi:5-methylcytosine-specific restriction protein B